MRVLAEEIFVEEATIRFYGFRIQTRMAVVRLLEDRLFLYSPVSLHPALRSDLDRLGTVAFIVSPNKIHHMALSEYRDAFPSARVYAPPGLPERRPDLSFDRVLGAAPDPGWEGDLDQVLIDGNVFFSEALFFHHRSRTLLVGDFVENFTRETASLPARMVAACWGVRARPMASPEFRYYTQDPAAFSGSLDRANLWGFERIFLCHGDLIEADARSIFEGVCRELLEQVHARGRLARWAWRRVARIQ